MVVLGGLKFPMSELPLQGSRVRLPKSTRAWPGPQSGLPGDNMVRIERLSVEIGLGITLRPYVLPTVESMDYAPTDYPHNPSKARGVIFLSSRIAKTSKKKRGDIPRPCVNDFLIFHNKTTESKP